MDSNEILALFEKTGALLKGHFLLSSGLHSNHYFQCALVLQYPSYAERLGREMGNLFEREGVTCVIGPALGGITLAYEVARALKARGMFAERLNGAMQIRRGFRISPDDKVLVVEDVITTGGSVGEVVDLVKSSATVAGVACIVDRSTAAVPLEVPFRSLIRMEVKTYQPADCPLCLANTPLSQPGSKGVSR